MFLSAPPTPTPAGPPSDLRPGLAARSWGMWSSPFPVRKDHGDPECPGECSQSHLQQGPLSLAPGQEETRPVMGVAPGQGMFLQEAATGWHRPRPSLAGGGVGVRWSAFIRGRAPQSPGKEGPASRGALAGQEGPEGWASPEGQGWAGQAGDWREVEAGGTAWGAFLQGRGTHSQTCRIHGSWF